VDVDVIQSNWYWRHQLRTLRFTKDSILRLRPGYEDIRAAHKVLPPPFAILQRAFLLIAPAVRGRQGDQAGGRHEPRD
jgi:hypothetical protein